MQRLIKWLLGRRFWLLLAAVLFVQIFPVVTAALFVADGRARGLIESAKLAVPGVAAVVLLGLVSGGSMIVLGFIAVLTMFGGVAMGGVLAWSRSLALALQGTLVGLFMLATLTALLAPDAETMMRPLLEELTELMRAGGATDNQLRQILNTDPVMLLSLIFAGISIQVVGALFLGYWWYASTDEAVGFGREFRALKLGRILGIACMIVMVVGLVTTPALVDYLAAIAVVAFLVQGLSVLHAWSHSKNWNGAIVGLVYVSLITPLSGITVMGLSAAGLIDNFFALRAPLEG